MNRASKIQSLSLCGSSWSTVHCGCICCGDEAKKKGLAPEQYAPDAIRRCGLYQGAELRRKAGGGDSLKGLKKTLFSKPAQWMFEMDIKQCTDDHLDIDFHYCPLVKA